MQRNMGDVVLIRLVNKQKSSISKVYDKKSLKPVFCNSTDVQESLLKFMCDILPCLTGSINKTETIDSLMNLISHPLHFVR